MNTILIDDEEGGRTVLKSLLNKYHPKINVVAQAANGIEGAEQIKIHQPDFVFLDVDMPLCDGFEMLNKMDNIDFEIVFTTAYNEYAIKAFKYSAFDFLLKPVVLEELNATIYRLQNKLTNRKNSDQVKDLLKILKGNQQGIKKIAINSHEGFEIIDTDNIILLEAEGSYTRFYLKNNSQYLSSNGIGEYEDLLDANLFIRIHKSFIININEVKKYIKGDGGSVILSNEKEAFVSKRKKEFFLSMFKKG